MCEAHFGLSELSCTSARSPRSYDQSFVTVIHFTPNAIHQDIEAGFLVRDRALAQTLASHFQRLIDTTLVVPLPPVP